MNMLIDVLLDSLMDTAELVPFLLVTYLAMEAIEHGFAGSAESLIARADKGGPVAGALLGAVPQCGFSAMAATLYAGRIVTAGTLVAVILSTSDELIPVFMARGAAATQLVTLVAIKVAIGMTTGLAVDVALRALHRAGDGHPHIAELCAQAHCHCGEIGETGAAQGAPAHMATRTHAHGAHAGSHGRHARVHEHDREGGHALLHILRSAAIHTLEVTLFIFVITLCFGTVIELVGEEQLALLLGIHPVRAAFIAALVGLIPNCGASVALTQLYLDGILATGPLLAGMLVSGGMGLLVLFRTNADQRQNIEIAAFVYLVGVLCGIVAQMLGFAL
jgi:hypothetical protein